MAQAFRFALGLRVVHHAITNGRENTRKTAQA
jgi:hypothetical protein